MDSWHRRVWQKVRTHPARAWFLVLAIIALPVFFLAIPPRRECPVTKEKCDFVKQWMSREEVRAVFGVPPGDYTGGESLEPAFADYWKGPNCCVYVFYDREGGSAVEIVRSDMGVPKPTTWERIRSIFWEWFHPGSR
jgi:hypothetical protein